MINWVAELCSYKYLNRDPDPLVTPMMIHWKCQDVDGTDVGEVIGSTGVEGLSEFLESQMVRVTSVIMLNWLHNAMGTEQVTATEAAATAALENIQLPPMGSTPPDDGV